MTTILLLVSRQEYLNLIFPMLEYLECDSQQTNLLVIVDGSTELYMTTRNFTDASKFNQKLCVQYKSTQPFKNVDLGVRRKRIADIHNFAKQFIKKADYIFCIEDDTTFKTDTLDKLQKDYQMLPYAGFIQGVQIGRHGINHFGAWQVDRLYKPKEITSQGGHNDGIKECDAGGLYCMLTRSENYMAHTFKPYDTGDLGPDVDYGLALREQGYKNYTDWSIMCNHHTKHGVIEPRSTETQTVKFLRDEYRWRQKSIN